MTDEIGAFVPGQQFRVEGKPGGPLSGLSFAACTNAAERAEVKRARVVWIDCDRARQVGIGLGGTAGKKSFDTLAIKRARDI